MTSTSMPTQSFRKTSSKQMGRRSSSVGLSVLGIRCSHRLVHSTGMVCVSHSPHRA